MITEQMPRSQLVKQWKSKAEELRAQGEDATHLQRFLQQVDALPGQTVGDLFHHWSVRQSEQRPIWSFALMLLCALAGFLALKCAGAGFALAVVALLGCLGIQHHLLMVDAQEAFSRELMARADFAL